MKNPEKILVTGGSGLIGSALKRLKVPNAIFLSRKDGDLTDFNQTLKIFKKHKPTHVIHLAAQVGGIGGNSMHTGEYFRNNIMININVLEAARLTDVKKLISFMSTCIFPDKCEYPLNEKNLHNGPPHPSNFGYAYAKRMLEVQSNAYRNEWGCNFIVAIPTNIYGPNDNFSPTEGHVVPSLIQKCYLAKKNNTDLYVWGSGKPLREFVLSDDIGKLAIWALKNYNEPSPIILSSGAEVSIENLVKMIAKEMNFKGKITLDSSKPDGQFRKPSDTTKFLKYKPDFKFTSIEKGVKKTVRWFIENYPNIRK
ncbi:MAG: GDP-L-fucose synthase [Candidatus Taylorbacteria bacterium]|nr:GDP-L-fucose synthase [Candidatus Taylorbacteria bacterium]